MKEDMKKLMCKKACEACHVEYKQASPPGKESGSEWVVVVVRQLLGKKHQRKALKDNFLYDKHLSLAMRQLQSHVEMQHCTLDLCHGPRCQAPEHPWEAPQDLAKVTLRTFLVIRRISPCNIPYAIPPPRPPIASWCLGSLHVKTTWKRPAEFLHHPKPWNERSATIYPPPWAPQMCQCKPEAQIQFHLPCGLFQGFPVASKHDSWHQKQGQSSDDSQSVPRQDPWLWEAARNHY